MDPRSNGVPTASRLPQHDRVVWLMAVVFNAALAGPWLAAGWFILCSTTTRHEGVIVGPAAVLMFGPPLVAILIGLYHHLAGSPRRQVRAAVASVVVWLISASPLLYRVGSNWVNR